MLIEGVKLSRLAESSLCTYLKEKQKDTIRFWCYVYVYCLHVVIFKKCIEYILHCHCNDC